jgi:two-component system capsular synthesis sensor histidine kinase RcsC
MQILALSGQYYRRMLYGCAVFLATAILSVSVFSGFSAFSQFRERQIGVFVGKREQIKSEVDRLFVRVIQFAEMYGHLRLQMSYGKEMPLLLSDRKIFNENDGISLRHPNLTGAPFSLVTRKNASRNDEEQAGLLLLLKLASSLPMFNPLDPGVTLDGFIYTSDKSWLAISPPLTGKERVSSRSLGVQEFMESISASVDAAFITHSLSAANVQGSTGQSVIWMTPSDSKTFWREAMTQLAVRISLGDDNTATAVFSISPGQFKQFFMRNDHTPGLFVFDSSATRAFFSGADDDVSRSQMSKIGENAARITADGDQINYFHRNGTFFVAQKIDGPGWNIVYVFNWQDILAGLRGDLITGALWTSFLLLLVWVATIYSDKYIIGALQKRAFALIETRQFSQSIIDTLPVGIAVYAPDTGAVMLQNAVAVQMFESADISSAGFYARIVSTSRFSEPVLATSYGCAMIETELPQRGGGVNYLGVAYSTTRFSGQDVVLLGLIDMNTHKAHEALLLDAKKSADQANQEKSMFLAQVSHEIRTPLHGVIGHMELLSHEVLTPEQHRRIEMIRRSLDTLMSLVNDILDVTKIESRAIHLNVAPMNLNDVLEECAQLFAPLILSKNLQFYCFPDAALDLPVLGDGKRLMQILQNLVGNAVKFTERGSVTLSVRQLSKQDRLSWVRFEIADTGIGISVDAQQRIFEYLEQGDETISRRFGGTGLGLFLCRSLTHLMKGKISLSSNEGGSVFGVEIPFPLAEPLEQVEDGLRPLQGSLIAVICEHPAWRRVLTTYVEKWGGSVVDPSMQAAPSISIIAGSTKGEPQGVTSLLGAVIVSSKGSVVPVMEANGRSRIEVTAFSMHALLEALLVLRGTSGDKPGSTPAEKTVAAPLNILVAEDNPVNMVLITHQLQALGYSAIRVARDGRDALEQWDQQEADVVITDMGMPHLDGSSLAREIRKRNPHAVIIATTAANPIDESDTWDVFTDVMRKPSSLDDVRRVLADVRPAAHPAANAHAVNSSSGIDNNKLDQTLHSAFRESWASDRQKLHAAFMSQDREKIFRTLHRIQGGLMTMGEDELAAECIRLQRDFGKVRHEEIARRYRNLLGRLDGLVS